MIMGLMETQSVQVKDRWLALTFAQAPAWPSGFTQGRAPHEEHHGAGSLPTGSRPFSGSSCCAPPLPGTLSTSPRPAHTAPRPTRGGGRDWVFFQEKKPSVLRFNRTFALREFGVASPGAWACGGAGWGMGGKSDLSRPQEGRSRGRQERWCPAGGAEQPRSASRWRSPSAQAFQRSSLERPNWPSSSGQAGPSPRASARAVLEHLRETRSYLPRGSRSGFHPR